MYKRTDHGTVHVLMELIQTANEKHRYTDTLAKDTFLVELSSQIGTAWITVKLPVVLTTERNTNTTYSIGYTESDEPHKGDGTFESTIDYIGRIKINFVVVPPSSYLFAIAFQIQ